MTEIHAGIDQSFKNTGIVVVQNGIVLGYTVLSYDGKPKTPVEKALRAQEIVHRAVEFVSGFGATRVYIEGLSFGSAGDAARDLAGLQMMFLAALANAEMEISVIAPPTLKKFATGNGRAGKKDMFEALPPQIREEFGMVKIKDGRTDLTDAFFLANFAVV